MSEIRSDLPFKALSIRQPWAWAIVSAGKDIENRTWATKFRGRFCIHAAKGFGGWNEALIFMQERGLKMPPEKKLLQTGGIIAVATLADCVTESASPWKMDANHGFVLTDVEPVDFIPVKGALGFFDWRARI